MALWAPPRPGFRGFKGFCPPSAGGFRGLWCGAFRAMSFIISLRGIKTRQPGCARGKCTPSAYGTSPGGGGLLSASLNANLSRSLLSAAKTSPSGGSTAAGGDRGAFPTPAGRLYGLSAADRRHLYGARRVPTFIYHLPFTIFPKLLLRLTSDCLPSFHRPVFTIIFPTYYSYRDPSLALRMTVNGGKKADSSKR